MLRIFLLLVLFFSSSYCDIKKDILIYKQNIKDGNTDVIFDLAMLYFKNNNRKEAIKYFKLASLYGDKKAKYNLATIYGQKRYSTHNFKKAFKLYQELADENYPKAQYKVAIYLIYGLGVDKDYKKAVRYFEYSFFKNNYKPAACGLALMYASGKGLFPNMGRARELAQNGYEKEIPLCVRVYDDFNLQKYDKDKGFKYGFYR
ncbi:MAG: tetratricopeptide repeat protein [Campylobacterota bacterium]|nr:tetratricopeptide repeat protein [Campylobacterota bacterium]